MPVKIICLGKTKESWIKQGIEEYQKRLCKTWKPEWIELRNTSLKAENSIEKVKKQEALTIIKSISGTDYIIALDEKGKSYTSINFARTLNELITNKDVVFIIGGVYGLGSTVLNRADLVLSCSDLTFTHQMVRLLLIEQIYRAQTIIQGKTYHY